MLKLVINKDRTYAINETRCDGQKVEHMEWLAAFIAGMIKRAGSAREHLYAVYMNHEHRIICHGVAFSGDIDGAPIYPHIIAQHALMAGASLVAIGHNHPGGNALPSDKDMEATRAVKAILEPFGLHLTNSLVVVGDGVEFSDCVEFIAETEAYQRKLVTGKIRLGKPGVPVVSAKTGKTAQRSNMPKSRKR